MFAGPTHLIVAVPGFSFCFHWGRNCVGVGLCHTGWIQAYSAYKTHAKGNKSSPVSEISSFVNYKNMEEL